MERGYAADPGVQTQVATVGRGGAGGGPSTGDRGDGIARLANERVIGVNVSGAELAAGPRHLDRVVTQPRVVRAGVCDRAFQRQCRRALTGSDAHDAVALGAWCLGPRETRIST